LSETDCAAVLKQVELYLDGELETVAYTELEVHLTGCGSCMKRVEFRTALRRIVSSKCASDPVPGGLMMRIRGALWDEPSP
jgi:anti-sigma factor (TIGR02949 family)